MPTQSPPPSSPPVQGTGPLPLPNPPQAPSGTPVGTPQDPLFTSPRDIYLGLREKREVLWNVKNRLEEERDEIVRQLRAGPASDADKAGLEQRLAAVDQQIAKVSIDIAEADAAVAAGAAMPGALREDRSRDDWVNGPPNEIVMMGIAFTTLLLFPVVIAWARRLWRKASVISVVPQELTDRVGNIERNIETVALEIERIGEGQRFVTQLMAQRAEPVREALADPRKSPPA